MTDSSNINTVKNLKESYGTLSKEEIKNLSILLSQVFKKKISTSFLNWLYNDNPNGKAITYNFIDNEKIVAHYALVPITIIHNKSYFKAALSVSIAIHENYRGLYIFQRMVNKTFELAKSMGIEFVIGVSNKLATPLFVRCFKFKLISPLEVKIGLGEVLEKNDSSHNFEVFWNNETLSWRLNNPRFKYQIYQNKKKITIYNNHYKIFKIEMGNFFEENFQFLKNNKNKINYNFNLLNMWIGLDNCSWEKSFYFNMPNFLKPAPLNFIIKNLNSEKIDIEKKDIKFHLIDFEIF